MTSDELKQLFIFRLLPQTQQEEARTNSNSNSMKCVMPKKTTHQSAAQIAECLFRRSPVREKGIYSFEIRLNGHQSLLWTRGDSDSPRLVPTASIRSVGGRPRETKDMADFADACRGKMAWKEIAIEWTKQFPDDTRMAGLSLETRKEKLREAWRRMHGDKKRAKP